MEGVELQRKQNVFWNQWSSGNKVGTCTIGDSEILKIRFPLLIINHHLWSQNLFQASTLIIIKNTITSTDNIVTVIISNTYMVKSLIWNCAGLFKVALRIWLCKVCTQCVHLVLRPRGDMSTKMGTKMKTKLHVCLYFQPNFAYQAWDWAKSKLFNLIYNMKCLFPTSICDSVLIQFNYAAVDGLTDICYHLLPNSCPIPKSGSPTHSQEVG